MFGVSLINQPALSQAIGQAMVDKIIERTESNKDVNGRTFKSYSKEYVASDEFRAFGKSSGDRNMKLTGQMLGTLDVLRADGNTIKIGWDNSEENAKSFNHNTGDTVPKRQFFGVTAKDLREIKAEFQDQISPQLETPDRISVGRLLQQLGATAEGLIGVTGGTTEET